jgi:hypothetical protein
MPFPVCIGSGVQQICQESLPILFHIPYVILDVLDVLCHVSAKIVLHGRFLSHLPKCLLLVIIAIVTCHETQIPYRSEVLIWFN